MFGCLFIIISMVFQIFIQFVNYANKVCLLRLLSHICNQPIPNIFAAQRTNFRLTSWYILYIFIYCLGFFVREYALHSEFELCTSFTKLCAYIFPLLFVEPLHFIYWQNWCSFKCNFAIESLQCIHKGMQFIGC